MCVRMRRGVLYLKVEELGCNKFVLGYYYDDVIEIIMFNLLCVGNFKIMFFKFNFINFEGIKIIRLFYYIREEYIIRFI